MRKLIISAMVVGAAGVVAAVAFSQPAAPPANNVKIYYTDPLEKDPSRTVRLQSVTIPAGGGNNFHRHPGDQWAAIQEGEVTFTIKGQPPARAQGRRLRPHPARDHPPQPEPQRQAGAFD